MVSVCTENQRKSLILCFCWIFFITTSQIRNGFCLGFSFGKPSSSMLLSGASRRSFSRAIVSSRIVCPLADSMDACSNSAVNTNDPRTADAAAAVAVVTTRELVQRRLQVQREKKQARQESIQQQRERNLHLKRLLHTGTNNNATYTVPPLYAVKVSVDEALREELNLNGREKRGRVFIQVGSAGCRTLKGLKQELHAFFRCLRKSSFVLRASLPAIAPDGSIVTPDSNNMTLWDIESDEDVLRTFAAADDFYQNKTDVLKRSSILLFVAKDPNAPAPPPSPTYLEGMADPASSPSMTMLSFYAFPPGGILDPDEFALMLRKTWRPFQALGRVYVAQEGVNAQMSIPTNVLPNFMECCKSIPELGEYIENGVNVDPKPLSMEEFAVAGVPVNGKPAPPFRNLHIRVRGQVVADGLDRPLDWQKAGYDMPPLEWHEKLKEAREHRSKATAKENNIPLILDCRNSYETDLGRFEGAEPLDTENFRESWVALKARLADTPKDAPIMTYCTGGIRCVKVGAYLTQELGFTNVSRLAGGIIAYDRTLTDQAREEEPMFKGTNFVFDGRLGRPITEDSLATCVTCGGETSLVSNCRNDNCHKRIVQCETCRGSYHGTCSHACKLRLETNSTESRRIPLLSDSLFSEPDPDYPAFESIEDYSVGHSTPPPSIYHEIDMNTKALLATGSHMVSGPTQGRLLTQLASMTREGRVLELGTFTGYATACLLEGVANAAEITWGKKSIGDRDRGPFVMTMERDDRARNVAITHLQSMCKHGTGEAGAEAVCALRTEGSKVPERGEKVVSLMYGNVATCELVRVTDALAALEEMARGQGDLHPAPFDLVFVDADKTRLIEYADACLGSDRLLKKGGLIVVDNVLWKGLVLDASSSWFSSFDDDDNVIDQDVGPATKKNRRTRKLATKMHKFNREIVKDDRAEVLVLPVRDGLSIIRKR